MDTTAISPETEARPETRSFPSVMDVTHDVAAVRILMVNVVFIGAPGAEEWVLIDAGLPMSATTIARAAAERYGAGVRPQAIVLTHGHFDHVGALRMLARQWDVPVYAHPLELPYVTGRSAYPPPDPTVGGGMMARLSPLYPRGPWDARPWTQPLPADGTVPHLPGWRWVATPGHSPGHVSLFRESDRTLIAGDAFVTTRQESAIAVATQRPEIHGPPMYYTIDWPGARESVRRLAQLRPAAAVTGHGVPMSGQRLERGLRVLADHFDELAVPRDGRYVREPARADETGVTYIPPAVPDAMPKIIGAIALGAIGAMVFTSARNLRKD